MELSSPRFKALAVTLGFSFWFFIISSAVGLFAIERFLIFVAIVIAITQIFSVKLAKGLDIFAIVNTKVFLGLLYVIVFSLYGILFKLLGIDLLRTKKRNKETYWLDMEQLKDDRTFKQY